MAKPGTSQFTHQDDATAPIHTTHPDHQDAHIYGENVPPQHTLSEVILGPGAFGSPDPRTLGHRMTISDEPSVSAAPLDPGFEELRGEAAGHPATATEEQLNQMNKAELLDYAKAAGVEVTTSMKKDEIVDAIKDEYGVTEDTTTSEDEAQ